MSCHYDREAGDYLTPSGEPCRVDEYGDPTKHCAARRTCSVHIGRDELTCPRCMSRTRNHLRHIVEQAALLPAAAIESGRVDSEAVNLAGPSADPAAARARRLHTFAVTGVHIWEDEDHHPEWVLNTWVMMLTEDYGHPRPGPSLSEGAAYLERVLPRLAHDPHQDFGEFARDLRRCHIRIERVLATVSSPDRGVPCLQCVDQQGTGPRLVKHAGEPLDGSGDWWQCPRNREHRWSDEDYRRRVEVLHLLHAEWLTAEQIEATWRVPAATVRRWGSESVGLVARKAGPPATRYRVSDVLRHRDGAA